MQIKLRGNRDKDLSFIEQILKNRGVKNLEGFFDLDWDCVNSPYNLDYIEAAVDKFISHVKSDSTIAILVDVDMDGFSSAALLINYTTMQQKLGDWQEYHPKFVPIFHREKTHGLGDTEVMVKIRDEIKPDLLIVPDASGTDLQYKALTDMGIDIIVLDHHDMSERGDGEKVIVVNNQQSERYTNKDLSGVGIVWQFCRVLDDKCTLVCADQWLDLVAIGNVGDVMDLRSEETRFLVGEGIRNLNSYYLQYTKFTNRNMQNKDYYTPHDISFSVAPLFNAVCRFGGFDEKEWLFKSLLDIAAGTKVANGKRGHAGEMVDLVEEATRLATNTKSRQDRRKNKLVEKVDEVISEEGLIQNKVLVLAFDDFEEEYRALSGLVAGTLADIYQRPVILTFKKGTDYVGSLRVNGTNPAYANFKDQCEASGCCTFVAGHQGAAGIGIKGDKVQALQDYFNARYAEIDAEIYYDVDFIMDANDPDLPRMIEELDSIKDIYGKGIEEPIIALTNVRIGQSNTRLMGAKRDTISIELPDAKLMMFKSSPEVFDSIRPPYDGNVEQFYNATIICKSPEMNEWGNNVTPQLRVEDYQIEGTSFDF